MVQSSMNTEATAVTRQAWIDAFVAHVLGLVPTASPKALTARAETSSICASQIRAYRSRREADWSDLPLPAASSTARARSARKYGTRCLPQRIFIDVGRSHALSARGQSPNSLQGHRSPGLRRVEPGVQDQAVLLERSVLSGRTVRAGEDNVPTPASRPTLGETQQRRCIRIEQGGAPCLLAGAGNATVCSPRRIGDSGRQNDLYAERSRG